MRRQFDLNRHLFAEMERDWPIQLHQHAGLPMSKAAIAARLSVLCVLRFQVASRSYSSDASVRNDYGRYVHMTTVPRDFQAVGGSCPRRAAMIAGPEEQ